MAESDWIEKAIASGDPAWAPHPPTHSSEEAIKGLGYAMSLSALQVKIGDAGLVVDRARLVAGELEVFGYYIAPIGPAPASEPGEDSK